jgi:hypothetical protein
VPAPSTVHHSGGLSLSAQKICGALGRGSTTVARVNDGEIHAVCQDRTREPDTFVIGSGTTSGTNGSVWKLQF